MKKTGILNPALCHAIACMGHTDSIVICDAGLPIPAGPERIDLAFIGGVPAFRDVLRMILADLQIERAVVASELAEDNPSVSADTVRLLDDAADAQGAPIARDTVSHDDLKKMTASARVIVRTGETTPFANVILYSGVPF